MITADSVKADYRRFLTETVIIRRYTGTGPVARKPRHDVYVRARVLAYEAHELVGTIQLGDRKCILYADDIIEQGMTLPLTANDRCVLASGKDIAIVSADHETRKIGDVLIAIEAQIRG